LALDSAFGKSRARFEDHHRKALIRQLLCHQAAHTRLRRRSEFARPHYVTSQGYGYKFI